MKKATVRECEGLAKEFLKRAARVEYWPPSLEEAIYGPERAALRRISMDLTRALARLRRGE